MMLQSCVLHAFSLNKICIPNIAEASFDASDIDATFGRIHISLLGRFRQVSNLASFLYLLDCTLLPMVTVGLPLLGILNFGAGQLQAIDKLSHSLALFLCCRSVYSPRRSSISPTKRKPLRPWPFSAWYWSALQSLASTSITGQSRWAGSEGSCRKSRGAGVPPGTESST